MSIIVTHFNTGLFTMEHWNLSRILAQGKERVENVRISGSILLKISEDVVTEYFQTGVNLEQMKKHLLRKAPPNLVSGRN